MSFVTQPEILATAGCSAPWEVVTAAAAAGSRGGRPGGWDPGTGTFQRRSATARSAGGTSHLAHVATTTP